MKKVIVLFIVLSTGVPISCDMTGSSSYIYRIESLGIAAGQISDMANPYSFSKAVFDPAPLDTMKSSDLAIEIRIEETSVIADAASFSFIASAYADPIPPAAESRLSLISIYAEESIFAYGMEYKAGDNLANLFSISSLYYSSQSSILKFIQEFDNWYTDDRLYLEFIPPLDQPLAQHLLIDVTLENGTVFNLETAKIVVE